MRTLKLSHKDIETISQALGIAEKQFSTLHKTIVETTISVRNNEGARSEESEKAMYYHDLASKMAYLNIDINNGNFDV